MTAKKRAWIILAAVVAAVCTGLGVAAAAGVGPEPLVRLIHGGRSTSGTARERQTAGRKKTSDSRKKGSKKGTSKTASTSGSTTTGGKGSGKGSKDGSETVMRTPIDWQQPSQTTAYPNLAMVSDLWIMVSIDGNRTYVMSGDSVIYTMYSSAGVYEKNSAGQLVSDTLDRVFHVEQERWAHFYSRMSAEGANWWVSWKDHGILSVPLRARGRTRQLQARRGGKAGKTACLARLRASVRARREVAVRPAAGRHENRHRQTMIGATMNGAGE